MPFKNPWSDLDTLRPVTQRRSPHQSNALNVLALTFGLLVAVGIVVYAFAYVIAH